MTLNKIGNGTMKSMTYILERYGIPTFLLVGACWWFANHVGDPLVAAHIKFLHDQTECAKQMAGIVKSLEALNSKQCVTLAENNGLLKELKVEALERTRLTKELVSDSEERTRLTEELLRAIKESQKTK